MRGKQRVIPVVDEEDHVIGVIDQDILKIVLEREILNILASLIKLNRTPMVKLREIYVK